jgi:molybdopterin-guanine dinucleotide biosynthesis protein A
MMKTMAIYRAYKAVQAVTICCVANTSGKQKHVVRKVCDDVEFYRQLSPLAAIHYLLRKEMYDSALCAGHQSPTRVQVFCT